MRPASLPQALLNDEPLVWSKMSAIMTTETVIIAMFNAKCVIVLIPQLKNEDQCQLVASKRSTWRVSWAGSGVRNGS